MKKITIHILYILFNLLVISSPLKADVTVAIIAPKAGELKQSGNELFSGAQLAIKEINDNGGLKGQKIDLLTIDDRCDDRLAISTAQMLTLLNSKTIGLVVGPYCSNRFSEITSIYEKANIFQIIPTTIDYNTSKTNQTGPILFLGSKNQISKDFFKFYNNNYAGLKVGFIYNDDPNNGYSSTAKALFEEFQRYGKSELLKFYTLNNNLYDIATQLKKDNIDISFVLGNNTQTPLAIQNIINVSPDMIIFTNKNNLSPNIKDDFSQIPNNLYTFDLPSLKDSLSFTENLVNLRLSGYEPKGLEAYSYVAIKLWSDLVKSTNSFDYNKLTKSTNNEAFKETWGDFLMHSGSIKSSQYIIEQYKEDEFIQVY